MGDLQSKEFDNCVCHLTHKFATLAYLCFQIAAANLCIQNKKALEYQGLFDTTPVVLFLSSVALINNMFLLILLLKLRSLIIVPSFFSDNVPVSSSQRGSMALHIQADLLLYQVVSIDSFLQNIG